MIVLATDGSNYAFYLDGIKVGVVEPSTFEMVMVTLGVSFDRVDLEELPDSL
jgi:hypothetical protein